jgi:hypothetical protein
MLLSVFHSNLLPPYSIPKASFGGWVGHGRVENKFILGFGWKP